MKRTDSKNASGVTLGLVFALVSLVLVVVLQHRHQLALETQNAALLRKLGLLEQAKSDLERRFADGERWRQRQLAATLTHLEAAAASLAQPSQTRHRLTVVQNLKTNAPNRLSAAQLEAYLRANQTNAPSLLAAFRCSGDKAFLEEAMRLHPEEPQVALEAIFQQGTSPEERRRWLEAFKQSAPDNALPYYLSALGHIHAGQSEQALQELLLADTKPSFQDYALERMQDNAEACISAGYSLAEAKAMARLQETVLAGANEWEAHAAAETFGLAALQEPQLESLLELKHFCKEDLPALLKTCQQAGDSTSAQDLVQVVIHWGRHYSESTGEDLFSQRMGLLAQRLALTAAQALSPDPDTQNRIQSLSQRGIALGQLTLKVEPLMDQMSEQEWISYEDRARASGEQAAMEWLAARYSANK